jgi:hypothetical protein
MPSNGAILNAGFWVYNAPVTSNQFTISPNAYVPDCTWSISRLIVRTLNYIYTYTGNNSGETYTFDVTDQAGNKPANGPKNGSTNIVLNEFSTTGGTPDTTFPLITGVSVTPTSHTFAVGETVTITIGVSDTQSGIGIIRMANLRPAHIAGVFQSVQLTTISPTTLQGQIVISSSMDTFPLDLYFDLTVADVSGNTASLTLDPAGGTFYIDSSAQASIASSDGKVAFAFTPLASRTAANGAGWTAPDATVPGYHTVTTVSDSTTMDVFNITGSPTALHFQADSATPLSADSSTPGGGSIYSAKYPAFSFFWEDGSVALGGLEPASSPAPLYSINASYYNPGVRITSVGTHTTLYVFSSTSSTYAGTLMERIY